MLAVQVSLTVDRFVVKLYEKFLRSVKRPLIFVAMVDYRTLHKS
jgi:hypothetical protein